MSQSRISGSGDTETSLSSNSSVKSGLLLVRVNASAPVMVADGGVRSSDGELCIDVTGLQVSYPVIVAGDVAQWWPETTVSVAAVLNVWSAAMR